MSITMTMSVCVCVFQIPVKAGNAAGQAAHHDAGGAPSTDTARPSGATAAADAAER